MSDSATPSTASQAPLPPPTGAPVGDAPPAPQAAHGPNAERLARLQQRRAGDGGPPARRPHAAASKVMATGLATSACLGGVAMLARGDAGAEAAPAPTATTAASPASPSETTAPGDTDTTVAVIDTTVHSVTEVDAAGNPIVIAPPATTLPAPAANSPRPATTPRSPSTPTAAPNPGAAPAPESTAPAATTVAPVAPAPTAAPTPPAAPAPTAPPATAAPPPTTAAPPPTTAAPPPPACTGSGC
jgi:hypothetical protein